MSVVRDERALRSMTRIDQVRKFASGGGQIEHAVAVDPVSMAPWRLACTGEVPLPRAATFHQIRVEGWYLQLRRSRRPVPHRPQGGPPT